MDFREFVRYEVVYRLLDFSLILLAVILGEYFVFGMLFCNPILVSIPIFIVVLVVRGKIEDYVYVVRTYLTKSKTRVKKGGMRGND